MKTLFVSMGAALMASFAVPCHAQSSDYETALLGQAMEARIGITIPFGGDGKSEKPKPQLALIGRRSNVDRTSLDWAMKPGGVQNDYIETRLALTLSETPELRLNGEEIYEFGAGSHGDRNDLTAGNVALVAGAVMVTVVVVALAVVAACGGDGEDDKC